MTLKRTIERAIGDAFNNILGPGELLEDITIRYLDDLGAYDPIADTIVEDTDEVTVRNVLVAKPTTDDMQKQNVLGTDAKLVIPSVNMPRVPKADTDQVIRSNSEWDVRKVVEVPGGSVVIVYIFQT